MEDRKKLKYLGNLGVGGERGDVFQADGGGVALPNQLHNTKMQSNGWKSFH